MGIVSGEFLEKFMLGTLVTLTPIVAKNSSVLKLGDLISLITDTSRCHLLQCNVNRGRKRSVAKLH
jgi:hypothetical protein